MTERRKHPRVKATHIAQFEPKPLSSDVETITRDLSQAGAGIYCKSYIKPGKYVKIKFYKDEHTEVKEAVVAWSKFTRDKFGSVYHVGLNIPE